MSDGGGGERHKGMTTPHMPRPSFFRSCGWVRGGGIWGTERGRTAAYAIEKGVEPSLGLANTSAVATCSFDDGSGFFVIVGALFCKQPEEAGRQRCAISEGGARTTTAVACGRTGSAEVSPVGFTPARKVPAPIR